MIIPEDGGFPQITSSNLNAFNNIMIVKVDDKWIKPGENRFQLATLDRSKKGTIWPADNYVDKMIPGLPEIRILDEHKKAYESRKELNMSLKNTTERPRLFQQPNQIRYHFMAAQKPNLSKRKSWSDKPEKHKRFPPRPDINNINPYINQYNPCIAPEEGKTNALLATPTDVGYNYSNMPSNGFQSFGPSGDFNNIHHNMSNPLPPSNNFFPNEFPEYIEDYSPTFQSFNAFNEMPAAGPSKQYSNNNFRQKSRNGPNSNRFYHNNYPRNASNHGPLLQDPDYIVENHGPLLQDPDYIVENDGIGRNLHIPNSFPDQNLGDSVPYDNVGNVRNSSNNAHYSRPQNNRKQWRFKNHPNPRNNVNSLNSNRSINSKPRGNMDSTLREDVVSFNSGENMNSNYVAERQNNSFKAKGNKNSRQRYNAYNKNQRNRWNTNKAQNFKQSHLNQNTNQNFRASNARQ